MKRKQPPPKEDEKGKAFRIGFTWYKVVRKRGQLEECVNGKKGVAGWGSFASHFLSDREKTTQQASRPPNFLYALLKRHDLPVTDHESGSHKIYGDIFLWSGFSRRNIYHLIVVRYLAIDRLTRGIIRTFALRISPANFFPRYNNSAPKLFPSPFWNENPWICF